MDNTADALGWFFCAGMGGAPGILFKGSSESSRLIFSLILLNLQPVAKRIKLPLAQRTEIVWRKLNV